MAKKNYFMIREFPFLWGGEKVELEGKTYYIKYKGYTRDEAINLARTNAGKDLGDKTINLRSW